MGAQGIFEHAVGLQGPERAEYLNSACGADESLRTEVTALLRIHDQAPRFLAAPTSGVPGVAEGATIARPPLREHEGQLIGRYKLLQPIGEGGFGSVWMAEQREPVKRRVALKIIKLGMDTRQVIARFEAERQALAMMDHPHIARVLDAGSTETGRPYFVMEYIKGVPILEYCDTGRLDTQARLDLFMKVCHAIQHAHQKGIIHRDIKPSNVLVTMHDGVPMPKVIDFGIAKATNTALTQKTLYTEHRQMIGTPAYMSPEQAEMSGLDIDTRSDVYSLGVLLYELLTGTTPFDTTELMSKGFAEMMRIIREVEPHKPSTRLSTLGQTATKTAQQRHADVHRLRTILRGDLDWIVMKCLEKDRTRRYETANGLAADVKRYLAGEAVLAAPPSAAYRVRKFVRRYRVGVMAGSIVLGVLVLGVVGTTGGMLWALDEKERADLAAGSEAEAKRKAEDNAAAALIAADKAERAAYQAQMISAAGAVEQQRMDGAGTLLAATPARLRGWEYQHLVSRLDRSLPTPVPAEWRISRISRAPASWETAVFRTGDARGPGWVVLGPDLRTERFTLPSDGYIDLAISPDGSRAVWVPIDAGDTRPAALWDLETGKTITTIPIDGSRGNLFASWSPEGDRFIISRDERFGVYEGRSGTRLEEREAEGWVAFTLDSRWILQGARYGAEFDRRTLRLLDARTYAPGPESHVASSFGPYWTSFWQSSIACSSADGTLQVLDIADGGLRPRFSIAPGIGVLTVPAWSPDGRLIAVGTTEGRVGVWETDSQKPRGEFAGPQSAITDLMFLPGSGDIWACHDAGEHCVWPLGSATGGVLTAHTSFVYPTVLSKDGGLLVSGGWDGYFGQSGGLKLWDPRTGTLLAEHGRPNEIPWSASLTPDGRYAIAAYFADAPAHRRTDVIDLWSGRIAGTFSPGGLQRYGVCVAHPDGRRVISAYADGPVYVWELPSGTVLWETSSRPRPENLADTPSSAVALSPDGRLLVLADNDRAIRLVNAGSYADVRVWDAHAERIHSFSFTPDGRQLLSASLDDTVGVWDVATGALVARLVGHNADVFCAAMSPDGTRIASGGRDRFVRLWDTTHFENVGQLGGHREYVYSLAWSPDGRQLISGSGDSTVRIWDTRTLGEQIEAARARAGAMPAAEARIALARADAESAGAAVEAVLADSGLDERERELVRQAAVRFAFRGMPASYRAPRAPSPVVIDGKTDDAGWGHAPWSEPFVDIEGDARPRPRFETRARMCWDETNLYVAARLEEPHVSGTLKNHDEVLWHENDFEVFLDPEGDTRWYGEVEVNALGTIFDLRLERSYQEGGPAHHEWSPPGVRAAASIDGTLNDPSDIDRGWTVEIAVPHAALADHAIVPMPPKPGDVWRINFSRVQWQYDVVDGGYVKRAGTPENNWVWSPQHVVNMHVPREWGFVEFMNEDAGHTSRGP